MKQSSRKLEREIERWNITEDTNDNYFKSKRWNMKNEKKVISKGIQTSSRSNLEESKRYIVREWSHENGARLATMTARDPTVVNADGSLVKTTTTSSSSSSSPSPASSPSPSPSKTTSTSTSRKSISSTFDEVDVDKDNDKGTSTHTNRSTNRNRTSPESLKSSLPLVLPNLINEKSPTKTPPSSVSPQTSRSNTNKELMKEHMKLDLKIVELSAKKKELESKLRLVEGALETEKKKSNVPF